MDAITRTIRRGYEGDGMIQITRELLRVIKRMPVRELETWLKEYGEQAFNDGYAEGLTADLDDEEIIVTDPEGARRHLKELLEEI